MFLSPNEKMKPQPIPPSPKKIYLEHRIKEKTSVLQKLSEKVAGLRLETGFYS